MGGDSDSQVDELLSDRANVFADTSVLINYIQQEITTDFTSDLIESDFIEVVVGVTVAEEFEVVEERRKHIYPDFLDFVIAEEGEVESYDPQSRDAYFDDNDLEHIREIQMELSQLESRAEVLRNLRRFTRSIKPRIEFIKQNIISENLFEHQPGLSVMIELGDVISHDGDRNVVGDAALWTAEGADSSGIFVTKDRGDLLQNTGDINEALRKAKGESWEMVIVHPRVISLKSLNRTH
jgi:hypothetical protein